MAVSPGDFDLSELLAQLARSGLEACCARGLVFLYDHEGLHALVRGSEERFAALVSAVLARAIHLARGGHVFCGAQVNAGQDGSCDIVVQIALSAPMPEFLREWSALGEMEGVPWTAPPVHGSAGVQMLSSRSVATAAQIEVLSFGDAGAVVRLETRMPWTASAGAWADARGARAWVIAPPARCAHGETLARRLQRLGWHTTQFASPGDALAHLHDRPREFSPPLLVLGLADEAAAVTELEQLAQRVPPGTAVLQACLPGGPRGNEMLLPACTLPLGLSDLLELTRGVAERAPLPSGRTQPSPLSMKARQHLLLALENPVEQALASAMLHAHGYEVALASTFEEAAAHCERFAPRALVIDLQPDGRGLAGLRALRQRQLEGSLPEIPLIAACTNAGLRDVALAAGAHAVVGKPFDATQLRHTIESTTGGR